MIIYIYTTCNDPLASIPLGPKPPPSPEDHPLHMTGFLGQFCHDEILPAPVHGEGHHGVPHGEPVGTAHQLIALRNAGGRWNKLRKKYEQIGENCWTLKKRTIQCI